MKNKPSIIKDLSQNIYLSFSNLEWESLNISPSEICQECYNALKNLKNYTNAYWTYKDIVVLTLFKDVYLQYPDFIDLYPLRISLRKVYKQIDQFFIGVKQNCQTLCLKEAIAQYIKNEITQHPYDTSKNIFVPHHDSFIDSYDQVLADIERDISQIQEEAQKYREIFMASIYDVDKMDARTLKYFLMLLYARQGYKIIPIKQKNMFYAEKVHEKFIVQGKLGKLTEANALKYYESCPQDAPLIIVTNIDNANIDSFIKIVNRAELEQMISETKNLLDYRFFNEDFINTVKEGLYHSLTVGRAF